MSLLPIVFLHGSSGFTKNSMCFINAFKSLGFYVYALDHHQNNLCKPYETTYDNLHSNKKSYNCVIKSRLLKLNHFLNKLNKNIILAGTSEGGIVTALCKHPRVKYKIVSSFSIEPNYFYKSYIAGNAPILNVICQNDQYFGMNNSINKNIYKNSIGSAIHTLKSKKINNSHVFIIKNGTHSFMIYKHMQNIFKNILIYILFGFWCQTKPDLPKIRNIIFQDKRIIWFQI